jgi:hypothetical protein
VVYEPHIPIDDDLLPLLREANPVLADDLADPHSTAANQILAAAMDQTARRLLRPSRVALRRPRIIGAVAALALVALIATAATYTLVVNWNRHAGTSSALDCVASDQADAHITFDPRADNPVEACRRAWPHLFGTPAPGSLTACVDGSPQGSIKVYLGDIGVCQANGASSYGGATPEQRRLADFRDDLTAQLPEHGCIPYDALQHTVEATLAKHRLQGWSITPYENTGVPTRTGGCANVAFIDEPKRMIVLIAGLAETTKQ